MRRIAFGIAAMLLLAILACSNPSPSAQQGGSVESTDNTFLDLLSLVPDTPETREGVFFTDYARIRDLYGITLPVSGADEQALFTYRQRLVRPSAIILQPSFISGLGGNQTFTTGYLCFSIRDVDADIWLDASGQGVFLELALGSFNATEADQLIRDCDGCLESLRARYASENYDGQTLHSWGDGLRVNPRERFTPPVSDSSGRSMATVVSTGYVFRTASTEFAKSIIDALNDTEDSLADVYAFRLIAEKLDDIGAHNAYVTADTQDYDSWLDDASGGVDWQREAIIEAFRGTPLMVPYQAFATGAGRDDRSFSVLVVAHATSEDASKNADILKDRFARGISMNSKSTLKEIYGDADVTVDGRIIVVKLYSERALSSWFDWLTRNEHLLVHE